MIKRILAGAAAAGFAISLLSASSATADACTSAEAPTRLGATTVLTPGGTAYVGGDERAGYIGIQGDNGWVEASGGTTSMGGSVSGSSTPEAVEGNLVIGPQPHLCANGISAA